MIPCLVLKLSFEIIVVVVVVTSSRDFKVAVADDVIGAFERKDENQMRLKKSRGESQRW